MRIKRTLFGLLAGMFVFSMQTWAQSPSYSGGSGTQNDPYLISSQKDLTDLSNAVNGVTSDAMTYEGVYFKQTKDITLSGSFTPIGHRQESNSGVTFYPFKGIYNGDFHTIDNLLVGDHETNDFMDFQMDCVGLFGCVFGQQAKIQNLFVVSGIVHGQNFVGTIVGFLKEGAKVECCGVGTNVEVLASIGYVGGIVGTASRMSSIKKCVNYADVYCKAANSFNAGGIIGSSEDAYIEGCANYGDVFAPRFSGGIIGSMPISKNNPFQYYTVKSCYNAGDISSSLDGSGGIMGAWPYQSSTSKIATQNCFDYGHAFTFGNTDFGPIIAVCFPSENNQSSVNTFFDQDRFVNKDKSVGFYHGEPLDHSAMYSKTTLNKLNEGNAIPFVADNNILNQKYPVHEWLQDLYTNHNKVYKELTKAYPESLYNYSMEAGYLFEPNKYGKFYFINKDKQDYSMAFKAEGARRGQAMFIREKAAKGNKIQKIFTSISFFKLPLNDNFEFIKDDESKIPAADRWMITPEFEVDPNHPYFYWDAASEDSDYKEGYQVFVGKEGDITAEAYASLTPAYKTDGEDPLKKEVEDATDENGKQYKRTYFVLNRRKIDLSEYAGKKVRIAFHDNTHYKFSLLLGNMGVGTEKDNAVNTVETSDLDVKILPNHVISANAPQGTRIELFSMDGLLLQTAYTTLTYQSLMSQVCIVRAVINGKTVTKKISL